MSTTDTQTAHIERRDRVEREALLRLLKQHLEELPGLALTGPQIGRLFNIREDVCQRLLSRLVNDGQIRVRPDGRFVGPGTSV